MTAQAQDQVHYLGERYALASFSNGEPFSPTDAGYRPVMASTACYRGYVCDYEVKEGRLHLRELWVNHQPGEAPITQRLQPPDLCGVAAVRDESSFFGAWHFRGLALPLPYTGGLLIGRDFIRQLYVHMGFHPAWKYQHVYELLFDQGELVEARDVSPEMLRLRAHIQDLKPGAGAARQQIEGWIAGCFSRDYGRKAGSDRMAPNAGDIAAQMPNFAVGSQAPLAVNADQAKAIVLRLCEAPSPEGDRFAIQSCTLSAKGDYWIVRANSEDFVVRGMEERRYVGANAHLVNTTTGDVETVGSGISLEDYLQDKYDLAKAEGKHYVLGPEFDRSDKAAVVRLRQKLECSLQRAMQLASPDMRCWLTGKRRTLQHAQAMLRREGIAASIQLLADPGVAARIDDSVGHWNALKSTLQVGRSK